MGIPVKLQNFEGPLDLLLHLIEKNKFNIFDIPIAEITKQYLEYIQEMQRQDLDVMSEFLVMAATLVSIKSKMLLPKEVNEDGEEIDPREELVQKLLEYKMYKYISFELKDREIDAATVIYKEATLPDEVKSYEEPIDLGELLDGVTLTQLNSIFKTVMKRKEDRFDPIRGKFGKIKKEEITLKDVLAQVVEYAKEHKKFSFTEYLEKCKSKDEIILNFLAILELMKAGKITVKQKKTFDDITVCWAEKEDKK